MNNNDYFKKMNNQQVMNYKYNLSIISMFKNESTIIESWLKHYLDEGVEHFYLIDNGSTDDYEIVLKPYIDKITLVKDPSRYEVINTVGTQQILQNKYYLDLVKKESKWVFICDIDEYLYNSTDLYITDELNKMDFYDSISIKFIYFGSKLENTPINLPINLLYRENYNNNNNFKTIIKTKNLLKINCHDHFIKNDSKKIKLDFNHNLKLNHYQIISKDYFNNVRTVRGGGVHGPNKGAYKKTYYNDVNEKFTTTFDNTLKNKKELKYWWQIYTLNYNLNLNTYRDSYLHWINNKNSNKLYKFTIENFNWEKYINNYRDLKDRLQYNKECAWKHWLNHGMKENRKYT